MAQAPAPPILFALVFVVAFPCHGFAQVNPLIFGGWRLNLAKSVYSLGPPPTAQTQKYEPSDDGMKVAVETIAGNGVRIAYGYTANLDGKQYPMSGEFTPNGADTIAIVGIDAFTTEAILRRAGEVVLTTRSVISKDGKVLTLTSRGTNLSERPTNSVTVLDKIAESFIAAASARPDSAAERAVSAAAHEERPPEEPSRQA
jgi:hypothetical protein